MYTPEERAVQSKNQRPQEMAGMPLGPPLQSEHTERQKAVVKAFKHAWKAYKAYAWGKDELKPISKDSNEWFGLGLTLVDALDTMWLMGLSEEFGEAREWVAEEMVVAQDKDVNLFETTIRVMGGLLSTYHLTQDELFLERAVSGDLRTYNSLKRRHQYCNFLGSIQKVSLNVVMDACWKELFCSQSPLCYMLLLSLSNHSFLC